MLTPTQRAFAVCREPFPAFIGGFGCLHEESLVRTPRGDVAIADLAFGDEVLSLNENSLQYQLSPTSGGYTKGKANLYRVITTQGEFVASGHHRVRVGRNSYQPVAALVSGQSVSSSFQLQDQTIAGLSRIWSPEDDPHYWRTALDFLAHCGGEARRYGQRLREGQGTDQSLSPSRDDARKSFRCSSLLPSAPSDGLGGRLPRHIRQGQFSGLLHRQSSERPWGLPVAFSAGHRLSLSFGHIFGLLQQVARSASKSDAHRIVLEFFEQQLDFLSSLSLGLQPCPSGAAPSAIHSCESTRGRTQSSFQSLLQSLSRPVSHQTKPQFAAQCRSFASPCSPLFPLSSATVTNAEIIRIEKKKVKEWYWDIHVAGNNNYVTADGAIHHNSGKTAAAIARAMALKSHFPSCDVAYYLPTYPLVEDIAFRRFPELCERKEWAYKLNKASAFIEFPSHGRIVFRTMENPSRIIGYEVAHSILDELDTLPLEKAREVWNKVIARNRQKCGMGNTVAVATTPEGFRFVYERWAKNPPKGYVMFRAKTMDNAPNLPAEYIDNLRNTYPSNLLAAYLDGEFVNLTAGSVYPEFDRNLNASRETIQPGEPLHIGMDFNVEKMAAVVFVLRDGNPHAVDEVLDVFDTPAMARIIGEKYKGHHVYVYPDASGKSRKSVNASESDLAILRQARFTVLVNSTNPAVKDRVLSTNRLIHVDGARRLFVNIDTCPGFTEALEKQAYDKNGEPDKTAGLDHVIDAGTYFLAFKFPIVQRTTTVSHVSAR